MNLPMLTIWSIPYACRWWLNKIPGVTIKIPDAGIAKTRTEEVIQQGFAGLVLVLALLALGVPPPISAGVGGVYIVIKVYNLLRIKLNN